ncbi:MAG TPA: 2-oxo acid dehydrogenase subunit E2, partial [Allosphingosinicella sp.]
MATEVKVPTLGESITEATLGQWLKMPGDPVKADEPLASLETDKVAIEVPSPVDGVMGDQLVAVGDTVAVGAAIARIESGSGMPAAAQSEQAVPAAVPVNPEGAGQNVGLRADEAEQAEDSEDDGDSPHLTLSPAVRRIVLEHHLDPSRIKGTGKDGRLTKDDVMAAAAKAKEAPSPAAAPEPSSPAKAGAQPAAQSWAPASTGERASAGGRKEERVRMTRLRQTVARRLKEAQNTAAMLTTFNDVDMTAVMDARSRYKDLFEKKHGIRLGFMSFFVKAAVLAARDVPSVNAYIEGEEIVYHDYVDVSVAVSAPNGLVVPVIRDAQALSFAEVE